MNIDMLLKGLVFSVVINEYWYAVERIVFSAVDDSSVFHSYRELSNVVTSYEIETISKFNMKNTYEGFDVDISLIWRIHRKGLM